MKRKILGLVMGFLLIGMNALAADGDLIVDGNVGIGTLWPLARLHVAGDDTAKEVSIGDDIWTMNDPVVRVSIGNTDSHSAIRLGHSSTAFSNIISAYDPVETSTYLKIQSMPTTNRGVAIQPDGGNVGIGTTTPEVLLEARSALPETRIKVRSTASTSGNAYFVVENNAKRYIMGIAAWASNSWLFWDETAGLPIMTVAPGGDVAIGAVDPGGYKLAVNGTVYAAGYYPLSDEKFKENIAAIESPVSKILSIEGISFNWKKEEKFKDKGFPEGKHYGVIAQDIEKVLPEIVKESPKGEKAVAYGEIIPILIEAMKEQQKAIVSLRAELDQLKAK